MARYPAGYPKRPPGGGGHPVPVSRCVSAAGVRFSVIRCPPRDSALLTVGLPDPRPGPRRGYRVLHARAATGVGALYTPRTAVLLPAEGRAQPAPAALPRLVPFDPAPAFHPRECALRGIDEGSSNSPVRSSPRPPPPGWNGPPLRLPPDASAPRRPRADDARQGRGQAVEHGPGTTRSTTHPLILQSVVHSFRATSRRTVQSASEAYASGGARILGLRKPPRPPGSKPRNVRWSG